MWLPGMAVMSVLPLCPGGSLEFAVHLEADLYRGILPVSHLPLPGAHPLPGI